MKILQFIKEKDCPSREKLVDSLRLGKPIVLNIDPKHLGGYLAFNTERMRNHGENAEWFADFRISFTSKSNLAYLSTHKKKMMIVNQRFNFPKEDQTFNRSLSINEIELLCHLTEFDCHELNDRILACFVGSAAFNKKDPGTEEKIKKLTSMKSFKKKAKLLIPIVQQLVR